MSGVRISFMSPPGDPFRFGHLPTRGVTAVGLDITTDVVRGGSVV